MGSEQSILYHTQHCACVAAAKILGLQQKLADTHGKLVPQITPLFQETHKRIVELAKDQAGSLVWSLIMSG